jgi:uncharacterized membrane protein YphA (DoxX/SURF4 family)
VLPASYTAPIVVIGLLLLAMALAIVFAAPIFAVPIALIALVAYLVVRAVKRGRELDRPRGAGVPSSEEAAKPEPEPAGRPGARP